MAEVDIEVLKRLLDQVANAPSKKAGKADANRLEFLASDWRTKVNGYASGKLAQAVNHAKAASGRVKDKDILIHRMNNAWHVFKSEIDNCDPNT